MGKPDTRLEDRHNHRCDQIDRLLMRLIARTATDIEFRMFFVEIRDHVEDHRVSDLLHGSAHSQSLSRSRGALLGEVHRTIVCFCLSRNMIDIRDMATSELNALKLALSASDASRVAMAYEKQGGRCRLRPGHEIPERLIESVRSFEVYSITADEVANEIVDALGRSPSKATDAHSLVRDIKTDLSLALATTLIGNTLRQDLLELTFDATIIDGRLFLAGLVKLPSLNHRLKWPLLDTGVPAAVLPTRKIAETGERFTRTPPLVLFRDQNREPLLRLSWESATYARVILTQMAKGKSYEDACQTTTFDTEYR